MVLCTWLVYVNAMYMVTRFVHVNAMNMVSTLHAMYMVRPLYGPEFDMFNGIFC